MKEESVKFHFVVPVVFSEEKGKDEFIFIDFDTLDNLRRSSYVDSYKEAIKDAEIFSKYLEQDVAVVEVKRIIKFRPKRIQKVKKDGGK